MDIYTRKQLAEKLQLEVQTIIKYQKAGMPYLKAPVGNSVRYVLQDVINWMRKIERQKEDS